jgi:hypothetical protein
MRTLDHLYSQKLKGVKVSRDGTWRILLEGKAQICNHDTELKPPDIPKKLYGEIHFATSILEEERTQLVFHNEDHTQQWRIVLNPSMYSIKVPNEEESFPQRGVALSTPVIVQEHPDERIAEGPTGEEEEDEE